MLTIGTVYKWTASDHWTWDYLSINDTNIKKDDIFLLLDYVVELKKFGDRDLPEHCFKIFYKNEITFIKLLTTAPENFVEIIC